jgi:hypothetical protein
MDWKALFIGSLQSQSQALFSLDSVLEIVIFLLLAFMGCLVHLQESETVLKNDKDDKEKTEAARNGVEGNNDFRIKSAFEASEEMCVVPLPHSNTFLKNFL